MEKVEKCFEALLHKKKRCGKNYYFRFKTMLKKSGDLWKCYVLKSGNRVENPVKNIRF